MRVLFIHTPYWNEAVAMQSGALGQLVTAPPLGMLYLSSYLKTHCRADVEVELFDYCFYPDGHYGLIDDLLENFQPDVIGMTLFSQQLYDAYEICKHAKRKLPSVKIVVGGKHCEIYPEASLAHDFIDYLVQGEGEIPFNSLLEALERGEEYPEIAGLWYQRDGEMVRGGTAERIKKLDELPFPDFQLTKSKGYEYSVNMGEPAAIMATSRGCPYECKYCMSAFTDRIFMGRTPAHVVDEMEMWVEQGFKRINFFDDNFNVNIKRAKGICREIISRGLKIPWSARCYPEQIDEELVALMAESGCTRANVGIESAHEKILEDFARKTRRSKVQRAVELINATGTMECSGYFILGWPTETLAMARETIEFACNLPLHYAVFQVLYPAPGTQFYKSLLKDGMIEDIWKEHTLNPQKKWHYPFYEAAMTSDEAQLVVKEAYRRFYFRPRLVLRHMKDLKRPVTFLGKAKLATRLLRYSASQVRQGSSATMQEAV